MLDILQECLKSAHVSRFAAIVLLNWTKLTESAISKLFLPTNIVLLFSD